MLSKGVPMSYSPYDSPLVSVIMAAYNAVATIHESISSVLAQTYVNWELIVVDDASTDDTLQVVKGFVTDRIHVCTNTINKGVSNARNAGIAIAKGKYLAFLDSDDLWQPSKLEKQVRFMEEKSSVISYTGTSYINAVGQMSGYTLSAVERLTYKALLRGNIMSCSSVMVRRDSMLPFPQGYMHEDFAVWLQLVKTVGVAHGLDEALLIYRMGEGTKSSNRFKSALMVYGSYRCVGYGVVASGVFMFGYGFHSVCKRLRIKGRMKLV